MKTTANSYSFLHAFEDMNRLSHFGRDGVMALWDYLEECEEDGPEMELDVIGLCCEFSRYESLADFRKEYGCNCDSLEELDNETVVIPIGEDGPFIIRSF
jgi:hypothetical protein